MRKFLAAIALVLSLLASSSAQDRSQEVPEENCTGTIYKHSEVSRRATFGHRPSPSLTREAVSNSVRGKVVLSAVLCRTGRVTDIQVIEGLPFGVTERAVEAARQTRFSPAEKDGQPVSVAIGFEFKFSYLGDRGPLAQGPLEGRTIEAVEVSGYPESVRWVDLPARMKTQSARVYDKRDIEHDWRILLETGDFDKQASTLRVEEGDRGGVVIVFELKGKSKPER